MTTISNTTTPILPSFEDDIKAVGTTTLAKKTVMPTDTAKADTKPALKTKPLRAKKAAWDKALDSVMADTVAANKQASVATLEAKPIKTIKPLKIKPAPKALTPVTPVTPVVLNDSELSQAPRDNAVIIRLNSIYERFNPNKRPIFGQVRFTPPTNKHVTLSATTRDDACFRALKAVYGFDKHFTQHQIGLDTGNLSRSIALKRIVETGGVDDMGHAYYILIDQTRKAA